MPKSVVAGVCSGVASVEGLAAVGAAVGSVLGVGAQAVMPVLTAARSAMATTPPS
ncbi:hypothetical protein [Curtobacterium sp. MCJR17_043]|uniref:hypothetical protein n=1 Tax=Curtobacterium sp. MCJR17_043 TaxID=2175660 RepID=UPI0024DF8F69|nr:hypothetical protein [Curtobacterium sp. MCJR17_043]WIB35862.1 hypothetical protein DEJ15_00560 [Curtobacterium sp. MCJR17_043]